jgi:MtaA/CmuA family methyltransferase
MTSRERYLGLLRREPIDILPRLPILMQYAAEYIGSNYGEFASKHEVLVEANLRCAEDFDFDQVSAISDPYRETQGFGAEIVFVPDGVPLCSRPPLADAKDLFSLPTPDPFRSERMLDRIEAIHAYRSRVGDRYSILGWIEGPAAEAADLRGAALLMMDLLDDPSFAGELMDRCVEVGIDFARAQVEAGADTIGIGDAVASQVSPALYRDLIQPREKRLVDAVHEMGAFVRLHICGDITHLLAGIARLGVDILDVDHMVDMTAARRAVGVDTVLCGNIDPAAAVRFGDPESIRAAVRQIYNDVGNPYAVGAGCEIPSGTPVENLEALCAPVPFVP